MWQVSGGNGWRGNCPSCGHDWREHSLEYGPLRSCGECSYEIEHGFPEAPPVPCSLVELMCPSELTLVPATVRRRRWKRSYPDTRTGLQWTIDGKPLTLALGEAGASLPEEGRRIASGLQCSVVQSRSDSYGDAGRTALRVLLGDGEWDELPGRVPLLVGECLDVPCGVITCVVERQGDAVTWTDFRVHGAGPETEGYSYPRATSYVFDRRQHDSVLTAALAQF